MKKIDRREKESSRVIKTLRSTRETPSKKSLLTGLSCTKKSERFEMTETASSVRKSGRVQRQSFPSPLRRSERSNKRDSTYSGAKKFLNLSDMQCKKKNSEKIGKQLNVEDKEFVGNEKNDIKSSDMQNNRMDARSYRSWFRSRRNILNIADSSEKLKEHDKSNPGGCIENKDCNSKLVELCSSSEKSISFKEDADSQCGDDFQITKNDDDSTLSLGFLTKETCNGFKKVQVDSNEQEFQTLELVGTTYKGKLLESEILEGSGHEPIIFKRKRDENSMNSEVCAAVSLNDINACISSAGISLPSGSKSNDVGETCVSCSKKQRLQGNSPKQELCSCKDEAALEANASTQFFNKCDNNTYQNLFTLDGEVNFDHNTCLICKVGGIILHCNGKGCERRFHVSCLNLPMDEVPHTAWYCFWCISKKIEFGVHSVSEGVESVWDSKEVEVLEAEGLKREHQYFVKFKGLAHIHNKWVPETQLVLEASLLAKFNKKHQVTRWKREWTEPHRLLHKKELMPPKLFGESEATFSSSDQNCNYEWLVKWHGLDYQHLSWELGSSFFMVSPKIHKLMVEYENRRKNAKCASDPSTTNKEKKGPLTKLSKLPSGHSPGTDISGAACKQPRVGICEFTYLNAINKLRESWHKGHNCVVFDDQDRIVKIALLIVSLHPNDCRPFLIVSSSSSLTSWEAEFLYLAPFVNVVVYSGSKDARGIIRQLEFYMDGRVMFQVLISSPEAIVEDLEALKCILWEAVIVDECQKSTISTHFEQLKSFVTDLRFLVISGQIKDSVSEYNSLLSFLGPHSDVKICNDLKTDSSDNISNLKAKLSLYVAYECRTESSKFLEYWVPVQLSNLQLEKYCETLLSNSMTLQSCLKNDLVGSLRDILISIRKCCDHPYNMDHSLQLSLVRGLKVTEILDFGIKASGKLQFLDTFLSKMKIQGLRTLIYFQTIGVKDLIGDILEDFIRLRFGQDSYERIDGAGVTPSKRQTAMNNFNKEYGRIVFLLDSRACFSRIKLSSVDAIIIYDSDLDPLNDIKSLQKIKVYSQFEQIKIFRLYSPFTVEEKALILAKQKITFESNLHGISRNTGHTLLMWGADILFKKLDELHEHNVLSSATVVKKFSEQSLLNDSVNELLSLLCQNSESCDTSNPSIVLKAKSGGTYCINIWLHGELEVQLKHSVQPRIFWAELLVGRQYKWQYSSGASQRNRKRVNYIESHSDVKKRNKVDKRKIPSEENEGTAGISDNEYQSLTKSVAGVNPSPDANYSSTSHVVANNNISEVTESAQSENLRDVQGSLHLSLCPKVSKLCEVLQFSEDVKNKARIFLEHVMTNHLVSKEPASILEAFQIALCWATASILKHEYVMEDSLVLARRHLNYRCKKEEVNYIYVMLIERLPGGEELNLPNNSKSIIKDDMEHTDLPFSQAAASVTLKVNVSTEERLFTPGCSGSQQLSQSEHLENFDISKNDEASRCRENNHKKFSTYMKTLLREQEEEILELKKEFEGKKVQLENQYKVNKSFIRTMYSHTPVRTDKLKILDKDLVIKMEENKSKFAIRRKDLSAKHYVARNKLTLNEDHRLEQSQDCRGSDVHLSGHLSQDHIIDGIVDIMLRHDMESSDRHCSAPIQPIKANVLTGMNTNEMTTNDRNNQLDYSAIGKESEVRLELHDCINYSNNTDEVAFANPSPEHIPDGITSLMIVGAIPQVSKTGNNEVSESNQLIECSNNPDEVVLANPSPEEWILDESTSEVIVGTMPQLSEVGNNEVSESNQLIERVNDPACSNRQNDEMVSLIPDTLNTINDDQHDGGYSNESSPVPNSCLFNHLVECNSIHFAQGDPLPQDQEPAKDCFSHSTFNGVHESDGIQTATGEQNSSHEDENSLPQSVDVLSSDNYHEATITDGAQQEVLLSKDLTSVQDGFQTASEELNSSHEAEDPSTHSVDALPSDNYPEAMIIDDGQQEVLPSTDLTSVQNCSNSILSDARETQPMATQNASSQQFTITEIQGDVPTNREEQNVEPITSTVMYRPHITQRADLPSDHNQLDIFMANGSEYQPGSQDETCLLNTQATCFQNAQAPSLAVQNPLQSLDRAISHSPTHLSPHPHVQQELHLDNEEGAFTQNIQSQTPPVEIQIEASNQAVLHSVTCSTFHPSLDNNAFGGIEALLPNASNLPAVTQVSNILAQTTPSVAVTISRPSSTDPLQNELERLDKEIELTDKNLEDTRFRLESDRDKELMELVAQIRNKYEIKFQQIKASYLSKRNEAETNRNKVLMNKILAAAFRSKCMDSKGSGHSTRNQDSAAPTIFQWVPQYSTQPTPVQSVQNPSALLSSSLNRAHPIITSVSPSTVNYLVGSEIRAPAPHLQHFRTSNSGMLPSQHASTSHSLPHVSPHQLHTRPSLPALHVSNISATDLTRDNRHGINVSLPEFNSRSLPAYATLGNPVQPEVVHLSDEDD